MPSSCKELASHIKSDHGIQLAAALQSVRGMNAAGAVLTMYFGKNDFARRMCKQQAGYLADALAQTVQTPALTLNCAAGDKPA